jgi:protein-tyrosine kinase
MSLIERAAKRLEELRRAGVDIPDIPDNANPTSQTSAVTLTSENERSVRLASAAHATTPKAELIEEQALSRDEASAARVPQPPPVSHRPAFDIDLKRLSGMGFVMPDAPRSRIADEFRHLKRTLIANISENRSPNVRHPNLVMLTSSVPGEGKTFSAVNLAMSLAMEVDRKVLLVDADVARPSLPAILGMPETKGFLDCLEDPRLSVDDVILQTNVEKLAVLPCGSQRGRATELLASGAMSALLDELSERHQDRVVLFDSPPILATTEARALATQMGQIVFVVRAETTLQSEVKLGLAAIEACPIKLLLLNQANLGSHHGYGYYRYGPE